MIANIGKPMLTRATARSAPLDGIRGFAVLIVFLSHSSGRDLAAASWLQLQGIGHIGVYLFFVLSSWLLTSILLKELSKNGRLSMRSYVLRRFFRIAPLYYLVLSGVFLWQQLSGQMDRRYLFIDEGMLGYLKHLIFYSGDSVFWTIPCEFTFYLLLPWLVLALARFRWRAALVMLLIAAAFSVWTVALYNNLIDGPPFPKVVNLAHKSQFIEVFILGVLGAWAHSEYDAKIGWERWGRVIEWIVAVSLVGLLIYICAITCTKFLWFERSNYTFRFQAWLFALVFVFLLFVVEKRPNGWMAKLFSSAWLRKMGIYGFSWYLLHFPVFQLLNLLKEWIPSTFTGGSLFYFVMSYGVCYLLSAVFYHGIEAPGIRFGRYLERAAASGAPKGSRE